MTLRDLLRERQTAIVERWREYALAAYPDDSSRFFEREKDRFANPLGYELRAGTEGIFQCFLDGMEADGICRHLDGIIKARAIQDLSPSCALSFVFDLKRAIRDELADDIARLGLAGELAEVDSSVDQIALFAFDIYTRCRERVAELRINEVKRNVAFIMKKLGMTEGSDALEAAAGDWRTGGGPGGDGEGEVKRGGGS